jgi:chemotaxis family two-component system response regulator Rcp1
MKEVEVLLVEDNQGDILLTKEAFINWKIRNNIVTINDGEEAICYLKRQKQYEEVGIPDIVILDINLPKIDGKEVLKFIKSSNELKHLPVVIFTSSCYDGDLKEIKESKADHYLVKPADLSSYFDAIRNIQNFWMNRLKSGTNEI